MLTCLEGYLCNVPRLVLRLAAVFASASRQRSRLRQGLCPRPSRSLRDLGDIIHTLSPAVSLKTEEKVPLPVLLTTRRCFPPPFLRPSKKYSDHAGHPRPTSHAQGYPRVGVPFRGRADGSSSLLLTSRFRLPHKLCLCRSPRESRRRTDPHP